MMRPGVRPDMERIDVTRMPQGDRKFQEFWRQRLLQKLLFEPIFSDAMR